MYAQLYRVIKKRHSYYSEINTSGVTQNAITRSLLLVTDIP